MLIVGRRTNFPFSDYVEHLGAVFDQFLTFFGWFLTVVRLFCLLDHEDRCDLSHDFLNMAKDGSPMVNHCSFYNQNMTVLTIQITILC